MYPPHPHRVGIWVFHQRQCLANLIWRAYVADDVVRVVVLVVVDHHALHLGVILLSDGHALAHQLVRVCSQQQQSGAAAQGAA